MFAPLYYIISVFKLLYVQFTFTGGIKRMRKNKPTIWSNFSCINLGRVQLTFGVIIQTFARNMLVLNSKYYGQNVSMQTAKSATA